MLNRRFYKFLALLIFLLGQISTFQWWVKWVNLFIC